MCTRARVCGFILAAVVSVGNIEATSGQAASEYRVKAAFLYKFCSFVEWPERAFARADTPLEIGVIGADALADELAQIVVGRTVDGRRIAVKNLRSGEPVSGLHVLFIGHDTSGKLAAVLAAAKGQAMLTVTESDDALVLGSMINFVIVDHRVRFDVGLPAVETGDLRVSARLLSVARRVVAKSS